MVAASSLKTQFSSSLLEIGEDREVIPDDLDIEGVKIKILSPTDCVKDRLASYIHFSARECLDQAVMVAKKHPVNLSEIKRWCIAEKGEAQLKSFLNLLKS